MRLTTGIDMIEVKRVRDAIAQHGERFLRRVYTRAELEEASGKVESLAARFAAKEAVAKALGCGIGPIDWKELEIRRGESNQPLLVLHGAAASQAQSLNLNEWSISLSHTARHATAIVVAVS